MIIFIEALSKIKTCVFAILSGCLVIGLAGCGTSSDLAFAGDIGCGRDTDLNGAVDKWCPGDDPDFDGFTSAQGDCDGQDWQIFPGAMTTKDCPAGQYKVCKANGTGYTACTASSVTPYCPSGDFTTTSGKSAVRCKYIDINSGNDNNSGDYNSPWKNLDKIRADAGRVDGTAYIIKSGTYSQYRIRTGSSCASGSCAQIDIYNLDCGPIGCWVVGYPGIKPILSPNVPNNSDNITPVWVEESTGWRIWNIEVTGKGVGNGIAQIYGADNAEVALNYIHDRSLFSNNNNAAIYHKSSDTGTWAIHHNLVREMKHASGTSQVPVMVAFYGGNDFLVGFNTLMGDSSSGNGGILNKHGFYGSTGTIIGNYVWNIGGPEGGSFGIQYSNGGTSIITKNLFHSCYNQESAGIDLPANIGGIGFTGPVTVSNNTVINCRIMVNISPERECTTSNVCNESSCSNGPIGYIRIKDNVFISNASSANSSYDTMMIGQYKSDVIYTDFITSGLFSSNNNCWYNINGFPLYFNFFSSNDGNTSCGGRGNRGSRYSSFSSWHQGTGYDANSFNEDPSLDSASIATSSNCRTRGFMVNIPQPEGVLPPEVLSGAVVEN